MTLEISNLSLNGIKEVVLSEQGKQCPGGLNVPLDSLVLARAGDHTVLLKDIDGTAGVLIDKLDIRTMFPEELDLRPFKDVVQQVTPISQPELLETFVSDFNSKHDCELLGIEHDVLKSPTGLSVAVVSKFILFCRVYGFWQLDVGDLDMSMDDEWLYITVVPTHGLFTGNIKVRI